MGIYQKISIRNRQNVRLLFANLKNMSLDNIPYPRSNSMYVFYKNEIEKFYSVNDEFMRLSNIMPTKDADYYIDRYLESKEMIQFCNEIYNILDVFPEFDFTSLSLNDQIREYFSNYYMFDPEDKEAIEMIKSLIKLCIRHINVGILTFHYTNPLYILALIKRLILAENVNNSLYFNNEIFEYTLKNCPNIKAVLKMFPAINSHEILNGYINYERRIAATKIQRRVLQWLYRPGGKFMKEAETHFYKVAISVTA